MCRVDPFFRFKAYTIRNTNVKHITREAQQRYKSNYTEKCRYWNRKRFKAYRMKQEKNYASLLLILGIATATMSCRLNEKWAFRMLGLCSKENEIFQANEKKKWTKTFWKVLSSCVRCFIFLFRMINKNIEHSNILGSSAFIIGALKKVTYWLGQWEIE